jgi:hypothetical protein
MDTVTITLNAAQARALAHWVNTFAWDNNLEADLRNPDNAKYLELFNSINNVNELLNPSKVRAA